MKNGRPWCLYDWQWPDGSGPGAFSWWHFMWLFICLSGTFCLIYFVARKHDKKIDLLICRIFAIALFSLETLKIITISIYDGRFSVGEIPFHFCSIPIYLLAIASFFNSLDKKIPNACIKLASYFGLVGGLAVMVYPAATLNTRFVYYSIHTMLWHSLIICYSFYYFASIDLGKDLKKDLIPVGIGFIGVTLIAIALNETLYYTYYLPIGSKLNPKDTINFFWIASHFDTEYPLLSLVKKNAHFIVFILCFIVIVLLIIVTIHFVAKLIKYHTFKIKKAKVKRITK